MLMLPLWLSAAAASVHNETAVAVDASRAIPVQSSSRERYEAAKAAREAARKERADAKAAVKADWCEEFQAWATDPEGVPKEVIDARFGAGRSALPTELQRIRIEAWAFQDERLRKLLGKTFAELSDADLQALRKRGSCRSEVSSRESRALVRTEVFTRAGHPRFRQDVEEDIAAIRKAQSEAASATRELAALRSDSAAAQRYDQLAASAATVAPFLDAPRRQALTAALQGAGERVVAPAMAERVRAVASTASGLDGLAALSRLRAELQTRRGQLGVAAPGLQSNVEAAVQRVAGEVAIEQRRRLDALGDGAAGLERGAQWQREFQQRIAPHAPDAPALLALRADFERRRAGQYDAGRAELIAQVSRTPSAGELDQWVQRVMLPDDARQPAAAAVIAKVDERREMFERNRVLGREPTAPVVPGRPGGEPSEDDIYQAISDHYRGVSASAKDATDRCNSGGARNDALLAVMCLGQAGAVGLGQGGTFRSAEVRLSRLKKLGCAPASGQPGYVCDFVVGLDTNLQLPPSMGDLARAGSSGQARFVRAGERWQLLPSNRE